jgi:hypothetical protein
MLISRPGLHRELTARAVGARRAPGADAPLASPAGAVGGSRALPGRAQRVRGVDKEVLVWTAGLQGGRARTGSASALWQVVIGSRPVDLVCDNAARAQTALGGGGKGGLGEKR